MKMRRFNLWLGILLLGCMFNSCVKNEEENDSQSTNTPLTNPWKDNPYKLNVIYFIPSDLEPIYDYRRRLSNIMLQLQKFYADNLRRTGYEYKSFGLDLVSDTEVNIITIRGKYPKKSYPYDGGGDAVMSETELYFTLHPTEKKSEHNLIIIPSYTGDPNNPGGPPLYSIGRTCFALDYPGMDTDKLGTGGTPGFLATQWIGALAHELGHGLNAPHNREHKIEQATLGAAIMGLGNFSYGTSPTHLTNATAALLSVSQTFASASRGDWYSSVQNTLVNIRGEVNDNKIVISGEYTSSLPVSIINVYHDPYPAGGNRDYDALAWTTRPTNGNHFSVECPLSDFYFLSGEYELRLNFYHENGTMVSYQYQYEFINGLPSISVISPINLLSKAKWNALLADSQEPNAVIGNILDGNLSTIWSTAWKVGEAPLPHHFIVDMAVPTTVKGFAFANSSNLNGAMRNIEIFKSDDNMNWTSIGTFVLRPQSNWQYVNLSQAHTMRYVKVKVTSTNGDYQYANLAEFAAFQ